jgi:hypothetical protein
MPLGSSFRKPSAVRRCIQYFAVATAIISIYLVNIIERLVFGKPRAVNRRFHEDLEVVALGVMIFLSFVNPLLPVLEEQPAGLKAAPQIVHCRPKYRPLLCHHHHRYCCCRVYVRDCCTFRDPYWLSFPWSSRGHAAKKTIEWNSTGDYAWYY